MKECTCNSYQLENFGCKCGAEQPQPTALDYLIELKQRADGASLLFLNHEKFMIRLCEILKLDYVNASEEDILDVVRNLMDSRP